MKEVWISVCSEDDLVNGSGVCALLVDAGREQQVALFRTSPDAPVFALSNFDPFGHAHVLSRGIIGSLGESLVVASPLYKQHFCLASGQCLEDEVVKVPTWPARIYAGEVQLRVC